MARPTQFSSIQDRIKSYRKLAPYAGGQIQIKPSPKRAQVSVYLLSVLIYVEIHSNWQPVFLFNFVCSGSLLFGLSIIYSTNQIFN